MLKAVQDYQITRTVLTLVLSIALLLVFIPAAASAADRGAWAPNVSYAVNDTVTYSGTTYKCIQGHTSLVGWEPPIIPAQKKTKQNKNNKKKTTPRKPTKKQVTAT